MVGGPQGRARPGRAGALPGAGEAYQTYQELLRQEGYVDFGDLILRAVALLEKHPSLLSEYHARFPFVLADEFQDTSRAELRLVTLLAAHGNVTVVGDDDQAIYGFRGVPWDNLLSFLRAFPQAKVVVLTRNFRSTQGILDCAMRLIRHNAYRLEALSIRGEIPQSITKELRSPHGPGLAPVHRHFPSVLEEAAFVAQKAKELHDQGIPYREMAVLYRNRYRPDPYLRALSEEGCPGSSPAASAPGSSTRRRSSSSSRSCGSWPIPAMTSPFTTSSARPSTGWTERSWPA